jgi:hypothetical protein
MLRFLLLTSSSGRPADIWYFRMLLGRLRSIVKMYQLVHIVNAPAAVATDVARLKA